MEHKKLRLFSFYADPITIWQEFLWSNVGYKYYIRVISQGFLRRVNQSFRFVLVEPHNDLSFTIMRRLYQWTRSINISWWYGNTHLVSYDFALALCFDQILALSILLSISDFFNHRGHCWGDRFYDNMFLCSCYGWAYYFVVDSSSNVLLIRPGNSDKTMSGTFSNNLSGSELLRLRERNWSTGEIALHLIWDLSSVDIGFFNSKFV